MVAATLLRSMRASESSRVSKVPGTVLWSSAVTTAPDGAATADLVFDTSTFHPQGGGQPSDVGVIRNGSNGLEVRVAKAEERLALHTNAAIPEPTKSKPKRRKIAGGES